MQLVGQFEVVEKPAVPPQQARVLAAQHRLSNGKFTHDPAADKITRGDPL
jgi:hypothetical protein